MQKKRGKVLETSAIVVGVFTQVRSRYLHNTCQKQCRLNQHPRWLTGCLIAVVLASTVIVRSESHRTLGQDLGAFKPLTFPRPAVLASTVILGFCSHRIHDHSLYTDGFVSLHTPYFSSASSVNSFWPPSAQSLLAPNPTEIVTILYCPLFLGFRDPERWVNF
jgi:hypothetical protein